MSDVLTSKPAVPVSWRDYIKIHPAADVFPLLAPDELRALGEDIAQRGCVESIKLWRDTSTGEVWLIDGRNRLDAMEAAGLAVIVPVAHYGASVALGHGVKLNPYAEWLNQRTYVPAEKASGEVDPDAECFPTLADYIIGANIRRRHLSKEQQAELIVKAVSAGEQWDAERLDRPLQDEAVVPDRSFNPTVGKKGGSTKGRRGKAIEEGAKHGISKSTIERALTKHDGKAAKPKPRAKAAPTPEGAVTKSPLKTLLLEDGPDGLAEEVTARVETYFTATDPEALRLDILVKEIGVANIDPTVRHALGREIGKLRERLAVYEAAFLADLPGDEVALPRRGRGRT